MNKKLFVFDLDGTLLTSAKEVSPENCRALQQIHEAGHEIAIATARPAQYAHPLVANLSVPYRSIFLNGALFETSGEVHRSIEPALFREIVG